MIVLNFAHPITPAQKAGMEKLANASVDRVIDVSSQMDPARSFADQAAEVMNAVPLTSEEWQTAPLIVNLPSFNAITALFLAEFHGRTGYFPTVTRLRPVPGAVPPQYEVAELLSLQAIRDHAREKR